MRAQLTVVEGDDVQAVEELPLVLVNPLHMHVKHGGRVDFHLVLLLQVGRELELVLLGKKVGRQLSTRLTARLSRCSRLENKSSSGRFSLWPVNVYQVPALSDSQQSLEPGFS